jgi:putative N6-adenine-specific DNA methylase
MSNTGSKYRYFAATSPGLEAFLSEELTEMGIISESVPGGVTFQGPIETLWACAVRSRIAESIRLRLKPFKAANFSALEQGLARLPWHAYLVPFQPFEVSVTCSESRLYHTGAIEERLRGVLNERWQQRSTSPLAQRADEHQRVFLRLVRNEVQVSIDATGERLHRRGYRTHVGSAPIRETLAAATLRILTRHLSTEPPKRLWDPCCGSGTFLGEWLQSLAGIQPGFATNDERSYAFEQWPVHPHQRYADFKSSIRQLPRATIDGFVAYGSDRDPKAISSAQHNLERALVLPHCTLLCSTFTEAATAIPHHTAIITNLPYGVRLKRTNGKPPPFLALDQLLRQRPDLRPALAITTEAPPASALNPWKAAAHFATGGLRVTAWVLT